MLEADSSWIRVLPLLSEKEVARVFDRSQPHSPLFLGTAACHPETGAVGQPALFASTSSGLVLCGPHFTGVATGFRAWVVAFRGFHPGIVGLPHDEDVRGAAPGDWHCFQSQQRCWRWRSGDSTTVAALMASTGLTEEQVLAAASYFVEYANRAKALRLALQAWAGEAGSVDVAEMEAATAMSATPRVPLLTATHATSASPSFSLGEIELPLCAAAALWDTAHPFSFLRPERSAHLAGARQWWHVNGSVEVASDMALQPSRWLQSLPTTIRVELGNPSTCPVSRSDLAHVGDWLRSWKQHPAVMNWVGRQWLVGSVQIAGNETSGGNVLVGAGEHSLGDVAERRVPVNLQHVCDTSVHDMFRADSMVSANLSLPCPVSAIGNPLALVTGFELGFVHEGEASMLSPTHGTTISETVRGYLAASPTAGEHFGWWHGQHPNAATCVTAQIGARLLLPESPLSVVTAGGIAWWRAALEELATLDTAVADGSTVAVQQVAQAQTAVEARLDTLRQSWQGATTNDRLTDACLSAAVRAIGQWVESWTTHPLVLQHAQVAWWHGGGVWADVQVPGEGPDHCGNQRMHTASPPIQLKNARNLSPHTVATTVWRLWAPWDLASWVHSIGGQPSATHAHATIAEREQRLRMSESGGVGGVDSWLRVAPAADTGSHEPCGIVSECSLQLCGAVTRLQVVHLVDTGDSPSGDAADALASALGAGVSAEFASELAVEAFMPMVTRALAALRHRLVTDEAATSLGSLGDAEWLFESVFNLLTTEEEASSSFESSAPGAVPGSVPRFSPPGVKYPTLRRFCAARLSDVPDLCGALVSGGAINVVRVLTAVSSRAEVSPTVVEAAMLSQPAAAAHGETRNVPAMSVGAIVAHGLLSQPWKSKAACTGWAEHIAAVTLDSTWNVSCVASPSPPDKRWWLGAGGPDTELMVSLRAYVAHLAVGRIRWGGGFATMSPGCCVVLCWDGYADGVSRLMCAVEQRSCCNKACLIR